MKKTYHKLIRDKIPEVMAGRGVKYKLHAADTAEFEAKLLEKLKEEVEEFIKDQSAEEMADIEEVINAILELKGYSKESIEEIRLKKFFDRGGFSKKLILEETEEN